MCMCVLVCIVLRTCMCICIPNRCDVDHSVGQGCLVVRTTTLYLSIHAKASIGCALYALVVPFFTFPLLRKLLSVCLYSSCDSCVKLTNSMASKGLL